MADSYSVFSALPIGSEAAKILAQIVSPADAQTLVTASPSAAAIQARSGAAPLQYPAGTKPTQDYKGRWGSTDPNTPPGLARTAWHALTTPETPDQLREQYTPNPTGFWEKVGNSIAANPTTNSIVHNIGGRALKTAASPFLHPLQTAATMLETTPPGMAVDALIGRKNPVQQRVQEFQDEYRQNKPLAWENLAGDPIGMYLGGRVMESAPVRAVTGGALQVTGKGTEVTGNAMENAGVNAYNKFYKAPPVETGENALRYDVNPGRSTLEEGPGRSVSWSRQGVVDKVRAGKQEAGQESEGIRAQHTAEPGSSRATVQRIVQPAIEGKIRTVRGIGGTPSRAQALQEFHDTYAPITQGPETLTVGDLYDARNNIDANINLKPGLDPTEATINNARRQIRSGLSEELYRAVPELEGPSERYAGLSAAERLAEDRLRDTNGSIFNPWKVGADLTSAGAAWALSHSPEAAAAAGLGTMVLPEIAKAPIVQTGGATALFQGGRALGSTGRWLNALGRGIRGPGRGVVLPSAGFNDPADAAAYGYQNGAYQNSNPSVRETQNQVVHNGAFWDRLAQHPDYKPVEMPQIFPALPENAGGPYYGPSAPPPFYPATARESMVNRPTVRPEPAPQATVTVAPGGSATRTAPLSRQLPSPESYHFSKSSWLKANPKGNLEDAMKEAERRGYRIVN